MIALPIIFLGYDERRIFSVHDQRNLCMLPVFTSAVAAEKYRRHFASTNDLELQTLIVTELERVINLIEVIMIVDPDTECVILNPPPPSIHFEESFSITMKDFLRSLKGQYHQKDDKNHHPRNSPK